MPVLTVSNKYVHILFVPLLQLTGLLLITYLSQMIGLEGSFGPFGINLGTLIMFAHMAYYVKLDQKVGLYMCGVLLAGLFLVVLY